MKKHIKLVYIVVLTAVALILLPYILWHSSSGRNLDVLILDKTVPDQTYREHKGITWALNHYKYTKDDDSEYDLASDYVGFHPQDDNNYYITSLTDTSEKTHDLIYMADTYGVYEEEFYGKSQEGNRSELIYGGLTMEDVAFVETAVFEDQTTLIAEFNSFASPTEAAVQQRFSSLLGLEWNGWIGRYFQDLNGNDNDEIPNWVMANYEQQTEEEWLFSGPGLVFVRDDDFIVVLEEGKDFEGNGVSFEFTEAGEAIFDGALTSRYDYWFDVIEATDADILAEYNLGLTEEGKEKLDEFSISDDFPAVTYRSHQGTPLYYFAGDYADLDSTPSFYQYRGLDRLNQAISRLQYRGDTSFYYRAYLPMMRHILTTIYSRETDSQDDAAVSQITEDDITYSSRVTETGFEVFSNGDWQAIDIKGVNMGMAKPGTWPGEAGITFDEYVRWLDQIDELGANVIRVYTIHPPEFYQALWLHNQTAEEPLYVMHGVWIEEESLESELDAYLPEIITSFEDEIEDVIDVIHGSSILPERTGHASGEYSYDISEYILGYILGVEWYPRMVEETKARHADLPEFEGKYFSTKEANAFEKWLAERMEFVIDYQTNQYQTMHPISFTNWPTTDLLDHPAEPSIEEDLVSVDPNTIYESEELKTGYFASYHVYPYYPDFLNYEEDYINFIDHRGERNNYAGYLNELIAAHRMPLIVAEFGVPASRGMTHKNPFGWNQGFISEEEQGEIIVRLFEDMFAQGAAGGLMFTWQDEWFKRTWNTMELDNPNQRPYWSNVQTNEQRFGLLSFETHTKPIDGRAEKWDASEQLAAKEEGLIQALSVDHDEAFLYFMIDFDESQWDRETDFTILLDTIPNQGNQSVPFTDEMKFDEGIDFVIELSAENESRVWVDNYYDPFYYEYGYELQFLDTTEQMTNNDGQFNLINYALSKPMTIPSTGEFIPFDYYETGLLKEGIGNPESEDYDSLSDYSINEESGIIEVRVPWLLLNMKDPSHKEIMGDIWSEGLEASELIEQIGVTLAATNDKQLVDQLPSNNGMLTYTWDKWEQPGYEERLKESYSVIQDYLLRVMEDN
ncbi:hypothetical protein GCM10008929_08640 [Alkalibacterium psychrotolerans]